MFNIFKKFIKKDGSEVQEEQEQNIAEPENDSESSEVSDVVEFLYDDNSEYRETFDNIEEKNEHLEQQEPQTSQAEFIQEVFQEETQYQEFEAEEFEEPFEEEILSLDQMEVEFSQSEISPAISQLEALSFIEDEIEEDQNEPEFSSIEEMETEFIQPEIISDISTDELEEDIENVLSDITEIDESSEEEMFSIDQIEEELAQLEAVSEASGHEEPVSVVEEIQEQNAEIPDENPSKGLFGISFAGLKEAVSKTSEFFNRDIFSLATGKEEIDDDLLDEMEEKFIRADIGVDTTVYIIERLRERKNKVRPDKLSEYLKNEFKEIIKAPGQNDLNLKQNQLNTFLITGVNGAGKTTLIGKLAYRFKLQGKKVLVAAGDTFRAAAEDQLEIWADRAGANIVRQDGADPASVVFDSIKKAKNENFDILLIDTAGRLHNKLNLMEELKKIKKVIDKEAPESLVESILVLDATTGQNGLKQAEVFKEAVNLTAVGLTKLDGTAKGGVILGIAKELNLPVKLIGVGEKMEDLRDFNADNFIEALF